MQLDAGSLTSLVEICFNTFLEEQLTPMICLRVTVLNFLVGVLIGSPAALWALAAPAPLEMKNPLALINTRGPDHEHHIRGSFIMADRQLRNLVRLLDYDGTDPEKLAGQRAVISSSFGQLSTEEHDHLKINVQGILEQQIRVAKNDDMSLQTLGGPSSFALYQVAGRELKFPPMFYTRRPFCQGLFVVHQSVNFKFQHSANWFIKVTATDGRVHWQPSAGPKYEPAGTKLYSGLEHENMAYLAAAAGGPVTLFNPDSYTSAAYRASLIMDREWSLDPSKVVNGDFLKRPFLSTACDLTTTRNPMIPRPLTAGAGIP